VGPSTIHIVAFLYYDILWHDILLQPYYSHKHRPIFVIWKCEMDSTSNFNPSSYVAVIFVKVILNLHFYKQRHIT